ncbi:MAG: flagellar biosynthetic protein FliO [Planctomycetota bacterium]
MPAEAFSPAALDVPYGRIVLVLGLTLLVSLVASLIMRRFVLGGGGAASDERLLRLKDTLSVGPRQSVLAVEANGRTILLASTQDRITFLSDLGPVAAPPAQPEPAAAEPSELELRLEPQPALERAPRRERAPEVRAPEPPTAQPAFASVLEAARKFQNEGWASAV